MDCLETSPGIEEEADLRTAYNSAFTEWVAEVSTLHAYCADDSTTVDRIARARERTRRAERAYRERRNLLLRSMSSKTK